MFLGESAIVGKTFLRLHYINITKKKTNIQSWTVKEKLTQIKCNLLLVPHTDLLSMICYPYTMHVHTWAHCKVRTCRSMCAMWNTWNLYNFYKTSASFSLNPCLYVTQMLISYYTPLSTLQQLQILPSSNMYSVINKCITALILYNYPSHYFCNRSTADIGVFGYSDFS